MFRLDWNTYLIIPVTLGPYIYLHQFLFSSFPFPKHFLFVPQIRKAPTLRWAPKRLWRRAQGLQSVFPWRNSTVTSHYVWNSGYFCPCASFSACPHGLSPARTMTNFLPSVVPSTPENIHIHLERLTTECFKATQTTLNQHQQTPLARPHVLLSLGTRTQSHCPWPGASAGWELHWCQHGSEGYPGWETLSVSGSFLNQLYHVHWLLFN